MCDVVEVTALISVGPLYGRVRVLSTSPRLAGIVKRVRPVPPLLGAVTPCSLLPASLPVAVASVLLRLVDVPLKPDGLISLKPRPPAIVTASRLRLLQSYFNFVLIVTFYIYFEYGASGLHWRSEETHLRVVSNYMSCFRLFTGGRLRSCTTTYSHVNISTCSTTTWQRG